MLKLAILALTTAGLGGGYAFTRSQCDSACPVSPTETISFVAADFAAEPATNPTTAPTTGPSDAPINKFCAVTRDEEVDPTVFTIHEGKKIGFCCASCIEPFKKDPAKYLKDLN